MGFQKFADVNRHTVILNGIAYQACGVHAFSTSHLTAAIASLYLKHPIAYNEQDFSTC